MFIFNSISFHLCIDLYASPRYILSCLGPPIYTYLRTYLQPFLSSCGHICNLSIYICISIYIYKYICTYKCIFMPYGPWKNQIVSSSTPTASFTSCPRHKLGSGLLEGLHIVNPKNHVQTATSCTFFMYRLTPLVGCVLQTWPIARQDVSQCTSL